MGGPRPAGVSHEAHTLRCPLPAAPGSPFQRCPLLHPPPPRVGVTPTRGAQSSPGHSAGTRNFPPPAGCGVEFPGKPLRAVNLQTWEVLEGTRLLRWAVPNTESCSLARRTPAAGDRGVGGCSLPASCAPWIFHSKLAQSLGGREEAEGLFYLP